MTQPGKAVQWQFILAEDGQTPVPCEDEQTFREWLSSHESERFVADDVFAVTNPTLPFGRARACK